jgi:hypothetical protein
VFVFRHPHREHLVAFICQNRLLITPGRTGKPFPVGAGWTSRRRVSGFSGFRGAALNQSRSASGVYTGLICYGSKCSEVLHVAGEKCGCGA